MTTICNICLLKTCTVIFPVQISYCWCQMVKFSQQSWESSSKTIRCIFANTVKYNLRDECKYEN